MNNYELAYLAGFFDADGCISISRRAQEDYKRGVSYRVLIDVSQKSTEVLNIFKHYWGGAIVKGTRCKRWQAYGKTALQCLSDLLPYLRLKKAEAEVAIDFLSRKAERGNRGCRGITDDEFAQDEADYYLLRELKQQREYRGAVDGQF